MESNSNKNKKIAIILVVIGIVLYVLVKLLMFDYFYIISQSMAPTIQPGQCIFVNKLLFGPRFHIGNTNDKVFRLYGFRDIKAGDMVLFNAPMEKWSNTIEMKKDKVYCKRVLGTPGDRIGAVDGHCWNDKVLRPVGVVEEQEKLRWMFDSIFIWNQCYDVIPINQHKWNIKNWGPLIVPAKGLTVTLDDFSRDLYCEVIEYETKEPLDDFLREYTFKGNYYFALGDNAMDSYDSRYWGFIPEDFIIGIVSDFSFPRK